MPMSSLFSMIAFAVATARSAKLSHLGLSPLIVDWFRAYLTDRSFRVRVGNSDSPLGHATSGVPQGSASGPIAFLYFINDLARALPPSIGRALFADDLKIYAPCHQAGMLQAACDIVLKWSESWLLPLSLEKCIVLHLGSSNPRHTYSLGDITISAPSTVRDLGILMSPSMKFSEHCAAVAQRCNGLCGLILRSLSVTTPAPYIALYKALVWPILDYGCEAAAPFLCKDTVLLDDMQKRFLRRVALRSTPRSLVTLPALPARRDALDLKFLDRLSPLPLFDKLFECRATITRAGSLLQPRAIAKKDYVNNAFAWRVSRLARDRNRP